jgi:hypothetical protein
VFSAHRDQRRPPLRVVTLTVLKRQRKLVSLFPRLAARGAQSAETEGGRSWSEVRVRPILVITRIYHLLYVGLLPRDVCCRCVDAARCGLVLYCSSAGWHGTAGRSNPAASACLAPRCSLTWSSREIPACRVR